MLAPFETDRSFMGNLAKQFTEVDESGLIESLDDVTTKLVTKTSAAKDLLVTGVRKAATDGNLKKLTKLKASDPASKTSSFATKRIGSSP